MSFDGAEVVLPSVSGNRRDYALDPRPIARGGQATVFAATHKPSGSRVAFKKIGVRQADMIARMKREIEAAQLFGDHPNVMPVLDFSRTFDWFVMPLAEATAMTAAQELRQTEALRDLISAMCEALRVPHQRGWVHRDLKPDNLLRLRGRWVVADWGLGRRPRGQTTDARRTRTGIAFGTEGFAAPELAIDAHTAGPQADIYSIGQIIGWALTGNLPHANIALLPSGGPWRAIVKAATLHDAQRRLASVDDLLAMIAAELDSPGAVLQRGSQLFANARGRDPAAPPELFRLAAQSRENHQVLQEGLLGLDEDQVGLAIAADPAAAAEVVRMLREVPGDPVPATAAPSPAERLPAAARQTEWLLAATRPTERLSAAARQTEWLLAAARWAEEGEHWDLLDETIESLLLAARKTDVGDIRAKVAEWIGTRTGQAASSLAIALRGLPVHPDVREALTSRQGVDYRILRALPPQPVTERQPAARRGAPRQRRKLLIAVTTLILASASAAVVVDQLTDRESPNTPSGSQNNPITGLPRIPGELALFEMRDFVAPWNNYPNWAQCRSGVGENAVTGSFPARPGGEVTPSKSIHCDNGGGLTAMFGGFNERADYEEVRRRYFTAEPPASPAIGEADPPDGLHVFRWSQTQRAIVWTDSEAQLIGLLITNSTSTDLGELWLRYQRPGG